MRRTLLLLSTMGVALLLAGGVAWAANIQCPGGPCTGTEQNDSIRGSLVDDQINALGGIDLVNARSGDDEVNGGADGDQISGAEGGDFLNGDSGDDTINGGPGTPDGAPILTFVCAISDSTGMIVGSAQGTQGLFGGNLFNPVVDDGNDRLTGGSDPDLLGGGSDRNDLSGSGGGDCLSLGGDANEGASGGDGDDVIFARDGNGDLITCGAGIDAVFADAEDQVAADCETVIRPSSLQARGAPPETEVSITTPEGTITITP
jgi:Ca2+-binding RTX toxin-like protein